MKNSSVSIIHNLWWFIPLLVVVILWKHTFPILIMLIFAYLGKIILSPLISTLESWIGSKKWSIFIVVVIFFILVSIFSISLFPFISNQIIAFQLSLTMDSLTKVLSRFTILIENLFPKVIFNIVNDFINKFESEFFEMWASGLSQIKLFLGSIGSIAFALGSAFLSFAIIFVFMIIFILEGKNFSETFLNAVPEKYNLTIKNILEKTSKQINSYIRGQLLAASSVAITSIIGLYTLQWITHISIPYTILIGIVAGLFNLIPFAGPIIGMIPAIIIYLITDQIIPIHFIYIILIMSVFGFVQLIDNLIMSPYIMGSSVGLHPMIIMILVLLGASVGGIIGMVFAVPVAAIIKVIIVELVDNVQN